MWIDDKFGGSAFIKIFIAPGGVVQGDGLHIDRFGNLDAIIQNSLHQLVMVFHHRALPRRERMGLSPTQSNANA